MIGGRHDRTVQSLHLGQPTRRMGFELRRRIVWLGVSLSTTSLALGWAINDSLDARARLLFAAAVGIIGLIGSSIVTARDRSGSR